MMERIATERVNFSILNGEILHFIAHTNLNRGLQPYVIMCFVYYVCVCVCVFIDFAFFQ